MTCKFFNCRVFNIQTLRIRLVPHLEFVKIHWCFFSCAALVGLLGVLDFMFVNHACHSIITRGASVQLVFGFEVGVVSDEIWAPRIFFQKM